MGTPYIGEIRIFAGNFAPSGWAFCDGSIIPISENDTLFALIGTTYGGDGQQTFALPDLRGRIPVHAGQGPGLSNRVLSEKAGVETVTLTIQQIPAHSHPVIASTNNATSASPAAAILAQTPSYTPYFAASANTPLANNSISPVGGSQPHDNVQPFLCLSFIISLYGVFPTQN